MLSATGSRFRAIPPIDKAATASGERFDGLSIASNSHVVVGLSRTGVVRRAMGKPKKKGAAMHAGAVSLHADPDIAAMPAGRTERPVVTRQMIAALDGSLPANVFLFDDSRILYANARACKLVGYSLHQLCAMNFWDLIDPEFREVVKHGGPASNRAADSTSQYPVKLTRKGGIAVWVDFATQIVNLDGGAAVIVIAYDVTRRKFEESALRERIAFEDVVRAISTSFIQLLPSEVDQAINDALRTLGEFADVDRSYVFLFSEDGSCMSNTHEWCREGITSAINELQALPSESLPWFSGQISRRDVVYVPDVGALPPEAEAERAEWTRECIQSLVCVPLVAGDKLTGFVGFDSVRRKKSWPLDIIQLLRDFSQILANAFQRRRTADLKATNERLEREVRRRERVERRMREQSELLRHIISTVPHCVFWKDRNSIYLGCNQNFATDAGLENPEDIIGKTDFDLAWKKEESEFYVKCDRDVMESGDAMLNIEEPQLQADGKEATLLTSKVPLRDADGAVVGVLGIYANITQLKHAEAALRESEQRLQGILENTSAVIFAKDPAGRYILANRRFGEIVGRPCQEVIGEVDIDLFPHETAEAFRRADQEVLDTGTSIEVEEIVPLADGPHTFYSLKFPLCDEHGSPSAVCGIATDISARKRTEEALLHRMLLEECLSTCSQTLLSTDDVNVALKEVLRHLCAASHASGVCIVEIGGSESDGWRLRSLHEVGDGGGRCVEDTTDGAATTDGPCLAEWLASLRKGEAVRRTIETRLPAERRVLEGWGVNSVFLLPIRIKTGLYGFLRFDDVDQSQGWKEEDVPLLTTAADMIGTFIERRRAQAELRVAKEAAESANQAKSRLLANMSHEIRTPITAMLGAGELLARHDGGGHDRARRTEMILSNGRHLLSLVDNLLDLSKIEANKVSMDLRQCSLVEIVADIWSMTLPLQSRHALKFAFFYDSTLPSMVHTDAMRLKQAAINLISNALKFTDEGHVSVRFQTRSAPEGYQLVIVVEDTGIGIAAENMDLIFESFQRAEQSQERIVGGVGLGLPLARWIAKRLGGTLEVESEEGVGSTFTLTVNIGPIDELEWVHPVAFQQAVLERSTRTAPTVKKRLRGRILLAEDVADVRDILQAELRNAGAEVTAVGDGLEAVRMASRHDYDLILMDIRMPLMDGQAATMKLRENGCLSPIIALTAISTQADMAQMAKAGFDDCWAKPISLAHLVDAASAYLLPAEEPEVEASPDANMVPSTGESMSARTRSTITAFEATLPARLAELRAALAGKDRQRVYEVLHQLAGAGGMFGHMNLSTEARRLMESHVSDSWPTLRNELRALEQMIEHIADRGSEPGE